MKRYRVELSTAAKRDFKKLPMDIAARVKLPIAALANNPRPHGAVKLASETNAWRIRIGDYRVLYRIDDDVLLVLVLDVAHRREAYR